jgi:signal transduction histidine kinase
MIDILRQIPLFTELTDEQCTFVEWGKERWLKPDEILAVEGDRPQSFWVLLEGEIQCTTRVGNRQVLWTSFGNGSYFGHELLLLDRPYPASARAICTCHLLEFDPEAFWKILKLCPSINRELLLSTVQRSQNLDTVSFQEQKLISLGTLISGLGRELDRPASVSREAVEQLQRMFQKLQPIAFNLSGEEIEEYHQVKMALLEEIEQSTQHISKIVQAAKDYAYLDRAPLQETDIHEGLENTLRILGHKLRGIAIIRQYDHSLPPICVYGSELNQAWTHIIENAIEAMNGEGDLEVRTSRFPKDALVPSGTLRERGSQNSIQVEIIDSGPGIPCEVQPHIFEQFFTTKDIEQGTGLGLPIAYQVIVERHQGKLLVDSKPGQTCFRAFLPIKTV